MLKYLIEKYGEIIGGEKKSDRINDSIYLSFSVRIKHIFKYIF